MTTSHICIMIAIIVYLGAMIYVGYLCSKKNNDTSDFYLGGRKLGPLVTAMSAEASDMSSWLLMGLPGLAYLSGIADADGLRSDLQLERILTGRSLQREFVSTHM